MKCYCSECLEKRSEIVEELNKCLLIFTCSLIIGYFVLSR